MAAKVFFSYSHIDEELRDQLEVQLAMLQRHGLIEAWHDRRMVAGDRLDWTIDKNLVEADIIILLVSPDFLASDFCYNIEKATALKRQEIGEARVISVILRPCDWMSTDLPRYLVTPRDGKPVTQWADRDEAFLDVAQSIRRAIEEIGKASHKVEINVSPFPDNQQAAAPLPRSSNLRLRKEFSEADKDDYLTECFDFIAKFFEASLGELGKRNGGIETRFRRIDANSFVAKIYTSGRDLTSCGIRLGGSFGRGISYSHGDTAPTNSMNEMLSVEADDQKLFLRPMGMAFCGGERDPKLSQEGAAEFYWSMLIALLQGG